MARNTVAVTNADTNADTVTHQPGFWSKLKRCWRAFKQSCTCTPAVYIMDERIVTTDVSTEPCHHDEEVHVEHRAPAELIKPPDGFISSLISYGTQNDWDYASSSIVLSDDTIRHAADKVNWNAICKYQDVSHELLVEFRDRINIHALYYSKFIKYETVQAFLKQLQRAQNGARRRPTLAIKRAIRQGQILRLLQFRKVPAPVLEVIKHFLGH